MAYYDPVHTYILDSWFLLARRRPSSTVAPCSRITRRHIGRNFITHSMTTGMCFLLPAIEKSPVVVSIRTTVTNTLTRWGVWIEGKEGDSNYLIFSSVDLRKASSECGKFGGWGHTFDGVLVLYWFPWDAPGVEIFGGSIEHAPSLC